VDPDVNYDELARCTDDFNGAQCKAVCVEAGRQTFIFLCAFKRGGCIFVVSCHDVSLSCMLSGWNGWKSTFVRELPVVVDGESSGSLE
jgi:hypothetical protein